MNLGDCPGGKEKNMKISVPGGRYWEPQEDPKTEQELEQEWQDFQKWVSEEHEPDPELPFD